MGSPYTCGAATNRSTCLTTGGMWAQDGRPTGCPAECACCMPNPQYAISAQYPASTCPVSTTDSYTNAETLQLSTNSMLPTGNLDRTADGTLTATALKTHIELLQSNKILPPPLTVNNATDPAKLKGFLDADEAAMAKMAEEFCYTYSRYAYCITQFIAGATASQTGNAVTPYETWLANARKLNRRLVDLLSIMKSLAQTRAANYDISSTSAQQNSDITVRLTAIMQQRELLEDPESAKKLYNKMVEFTKEKNKANGNLIALYSFLNLVALGMLFYVYRAT